MATNLPVTIDVDNADDPNRPTVQQHQQHHDIIHAETNRLSAYGIVRLVHNGTAYPARPANSPYAEWVGPVEPTGAVAGDTWVNTA